MNPHINANTQEYLTGQSPNKHHLGLELLGCQEGSKKLTNGSRVDPLIDWDASRSRDPTIRSC